MGTTFLDTTQPCDVPFGGRLRQLREAAGLTQDELASRSGLTAKAISLIERGERRHPYPHTVRALAVGLGLSDTERTDFIAAVPARGYVADVAGRTFAGESTIPWPSTPLLGRERELVEIRAFLQGGRLLTLTGTAGAGKTRLAIQVARDVATGGCYHAAFVSLAALTDAESVLPAMAKALGVRESARAATAGALRRFIGEQRVFVVLDNFEHLLGAATEVVALLEACPGLHVLATSRAPLRVRGEQEYGVPGLTLPRSTGTPGIEEVLRSSAGELFVERARAAFPAFALTPQNCGSVAAICWRLAGLPLALELVAARTRFLDPETLLVELDQALSRGWARDLTGRHRTMWAALDWSHDLLSEAEQVLFRCLAVCHGGFSIETAKAVGVSGAMAADEVVESLGKLVEHSLIVAHPDAQSGRLRYGMIEPVRQYAWHKLEESGADREAEHRHLAHFLALTEQADRRYGLLTGMLPLGPEGEAWIDVLDREHDNLRAALRRARERGDVANGLRLVGAVSWFWWTRGHFGEGLRWIEAFLALASHDATRVADSLRARALLGGGMLAFGKGDLRGSTRFLENSLQTYRRCCGPAGIAAASTTLAYVSRASGDGKRAEELSEEALQVSKTLDDSRSAAIALCNLGHIARRRGDLNRANTLFREAHALFERLGDQRGVAYSLCNRGLVALEAGDAAHALELHEEGARLYDTLQDEVGRGYALIHLGDVARYLGDKTRAVLLYEEALTVHQRYGTERGAARARARLDAAAY